MSSSIATAKAKVHGWLTSQRGLQLLFAFGVILLIFAHGINIQATIGGEK